MGSETHPKLPIVDLSNENLKPGTEAWLLARKQVQHALEDFGCFEAIYNKVPFQLHNSIFSSLEELFDLPTEIKSQKTSDKPYHGYIGRYPFLPLYESVGIDNPTTPDGAQFFTTLMWPQGNDTFRENAHSFSKIVAELDQMVTRMVFEMYGVGRLYESHEASTTYLLRCMKYRPPQANETNLGLLAHTDKTFSSILHQNQVHGLQIKTKDGQCWIDVQPSPSSFLFMAGDFFMAWSNDRIFSCEHQIVMKETTRYSLGLFSYNSGIMQVPEDLVDDKHPLMYKPYDEVEFLHFNRTPEAIKSKCPIKAYCGL